MMLTRQVRAFVEQVERLFQMPERGHAVRLLPCHNCLAW